MAVYASLNAGAWMSFLEIIKSKTKDPTGLLKTAFMTAGFQDIVQHFSDEKGPEGEWKPRSQKTQDAYRLKMLGHTKRFEKADIYGKMGMAASMKKPNARYNPNNKILGLTGKLRGSILPTNTKKIAFNTIEIFANSVYGHRHDSGTDGMPKREFMWFSETAKDRMTQIIAGMAFGD